MSDQERQDEFESVVGEFAANPQFVYVMIVADEKRNDQSLMRRFTSHEFTDYASFRRAQDDLVKRKQTADQIYKMVHKHDPRLAKYKIIRNNRSDFGASATFQLYKYLVLATKALY